MTDVMNINDHSDQHYDQSDHSDQHYDPHATETLTNPSKVAAEPQHSVNGFTNMQTVVLGNLRAQLVEIESSYRNELDQIITVSNVQINANQDTISRLAAQNSSIIAERDEQIKEHKRLYAVNSGELRKMIKSVEASLEVLRS